MLSENDRLILVEKKEEIRQLSNEIIANIYGDQDIVYIKTRMNSILNLLSTIASFTESKPQRLSEFTKFTLQLTLLINKGASLPVPLEIWCNMVNSIQFNFMRKKEMITIPKPEFNLFKLSLSGIKTALDI